MDLDTEVAGIRRRLTELESRAFREGGSQPAADGSAMVGAIASFEAGKNAFIEAVDKIDALSNQVGAFDERLAKVEGLIAEAVKDGMKPDPEQAAPTAADVKASGAGTNGPAAVGTGLPDAPSPVDSQAGGGAPVV